MVPASSRRFGRTARLCGGLLVSTAALHPVAAQPVVQPLPPSGAAERLSESLRVLASNSGDVLALTAAGNAALELNDENAAYGFFARAIAVAPGDPSANVGLGRVLVRLERADEALARFNQAEAVGADARAFLVDRGLAHDLRGDFARAQADYRAAALTMPDDEVLRRLALSQAIGGDPRGGLATLGPLLARSDPASYRAESFIRAMSGDVAGARAIAQARMSPGMAGLFEHFFARLPSLNPAERARAVHFGDMPAPGQRYASVRPGGEQLAVNTRPPPRTESRTQARGRGGALIPQGSALGRSDRLSREDRRQAARIGESDRAAARRVARRAPPSPPPSPPPPLPARITWRPSPPPPPAPIVARPVVQAIAATPRPPAEGMTSEIPTAGDSVAAPIGPPVPTPGPSVATMMESRPEPPRPRSAVIASVADSGLPVRPTPGSIERVDPDLGVSTDMSIGPSADAVAPGDQVIAPDGPVPSVPPAEPRSAVDAPESLLPPGALPLSAVETPRPGFAEPTGMQGSEPPRLAEPSASARVPPPSKPASRPTSLPSPSKSAPPPPPKPKPAATPDKSTAKPVATPDKLKTAPEKPKPKAPPIPERYWFQVATGGDVKTLAADLKRLKRKHDLLAKLGGATSRFGANHRLVVGPFDSRVEAKSFEVKARAAGLDGYVWVSPMGFEVDPVPQ